MESASSPLISIVIPVMNEAGNISLLTEKITEQMMPANPDFEILFIDDGSSDETWSCIRTAAKADPRVKGIMLSRNFGHQGALFAGLGMASGAAVISMDGDLQHPPELLPDMIASWRDGNLIVETERLDQGSTGFFKKITSRSFYRFFSRLSGVPISSGASDFRLLDSKVVAVVLEMRDPLLFLRGISHWVGFTKSRLSYEVRERHAGRTKYTLGRMLKFSGAATVSFSSKPLYLGIWIGILTSLVAFVELAYILIKFFEGGTVAGWASTLAIISLMFGVLFVLVGIIGVYIANIFETVKHRPHFLIEDRVGFPANSHRINSGSQSESRPWPGL